MTVSSKSSVRITPQVRYRDVEGSARWLCHAFGFAVHSAVRNTEGVMDYVHLTHGSANVIVKPLDEHATAPAANEETQSRYIYVNDATRHYEIARAEGAEIVIDLQEMPRLGRGYSCRDLEGQIWSFGTFDAWQVGLLPATSEQLTSIDVAPSMPPAATVPSGPSIVAEPLPPPRIRREHRRTKRRSLVAAVLIGAVAGAVTVAAAIYSDDAATSLELRVAAERTGRERSEAATRQAQAALVSERTAKHQFEQAAQLIEAELVRAREELSTQAGALIEAGKETAALSNKLSESERQWRAVEQTLTEQLDVAKATAASAQSQRAAVESTLTQRVFSLETSLREEQSSRRSAETTHAATAAKLQDALQSRQKAEQALQSALVRLNAEQQARVAAEQRVEKLKGQLTARRTPRRSIARAKSPPRPRAVTASKSKSSTTPKLKSTSADTVNDVGFQP